MTAILALDCATGPLSVAVWQDGKICAYREELGTGKQSARLIPLAEDALKESGLRYRDLTSIAATVGPGSFTAIRVALSVARGICFAAQLPGLGFTTLETMAYAAHQAENRKHAHVLSLLSAGKGEYSAQSFDTTPGWKAIGTPVLGTQESLLAQAAPDTLIATNASEPVEGVISSSIRFPRADALAELAAGGHPAMTLTPFYIRPPDAKPNVKNV